MTSKLDAPPLSLSGFSPATQIWGNSLQDYPSFAGETVGTRINRGNSLIMPLRLRGGYATECHAFSYFSSSSALIFSPPCGSCSVFEQAYTVYKNTPNKQTTIGCGCPTVLSIKQTILRNCGLSFCHSYFDSKDFLRGSDCENKRGSRQCATACCRCLCVV